MSHQIAVAELQKIAAEVRSYVFDFTKYAEVVGGETLSSPSVPAVSGLTIGSPAVTATIVDGIAAGKAVSVTISGGTVGTTYTVDCRVSTSGGATLARRMELEIL